MNNNKVTLTSLLDSELLASVHGQHLQRQTFGLPHFVTDGAFKDFIDTVQPMVNKDVGYMFVTLDRAHYAPGDTVQGALYFELFRIGYQTKLVIQIEGTELLPKRLQTQISHSLNGSSWQGGEGEDLEVRNDSQASQFVPTYKDKGDKKIEGPPAECEEVSSLFKMQRRLFTYRSKHVPVG